MEACPFLGGEEAAWPAASFKVPRPEPEQACHPSSCSTTQLWVVTNVWSLLYTALCFTVLLLTEATSSFKLLTVEVHLPGELVEYRILKGRGGKVGMQFHLPHVNRPSQPLICGLNMHRSNGRIFLGGCVGSLLLRAGFLQLRWARATLRCCVQASHCGGFSCCGAWALGAWASVVVVHGLSCSTAWGIFPDQGSNPCPLHWQTNS